MPFEYCARHHKRWEKGISVCLGCAASAVDAAAANAYPLATVDQAVKQALSPVDPQTVEPRKAKKRKRRAKATKAPK